MVIRMFANTNNQQTDMRQIKGLQIAETCRIVKTEKGWLVPSQSGHGKYLVFTESLLSKPHCTCPDHESRGVICKHIYAVEIILKREKDGEGNTTLTAERITQGNTTIIQEKKVTYSQDWKAYDKAQCNEKDLFMKLLSDLCQNVEQPSYEFGRPTLPLSEMVFDSALKVYSTFSLRRFMCDVKIAKERGYIGTVCSYPSVSNYMVKPELTPILHRLIQLSSLPLASVEKCFAVDGTGFSTSRFARYFSYKHGKDVKYRTWLKANMSVGVKTNIVTSVAITEEYENESPYFEPLVQKTAENFKIEEVSADKEYSSRKNLEVVDALGGTAFIPFKSNATDKQRGSPIWVKMYHYFMFNKEEFLEHYHKRSNVETTNHMIKAKFRDHLRSKDKTAQTNELLLKILCHNICVVIQEMFELGINPQFNLSNQMVLSS
jgi:transposase